MKQVHILVPLFLVLTGITAWWIVSGQDWLVDRDFFTYWGGGRGLLDGMNLYAPSDWSGLHALYGSQWLENPVFIYAPPTAVFFAPLAALPIQIASLMWVWLSELAIAVSFFLMVRQVNRNYSLTTIPLWALGTALSLPVILTLFMGQASALILLVIVLAGVLWQREHWFVGGVVLGLVAVKPQPVLLLVPALAWWLWLNGRWRALAGLAAAGIVSATATLLLYPNFARDWSGVASGKVYGVLGRMPTVWGIASDLLGDSAGATAVAVILVSLLVLACGVVITRLKQHDPMLVIACTVVFSLPVAPYLWNYDQILLLVPLVVSLVWLVRDKKIARVVMWIPLAFAALELLLLMVAGERLKDTFSVILPLLVGVLVLYATRRATSPSSGLIHNVARGLREDEEIPLVR